MMNSPICKMLDIEFPLLAFSHCRDVVAAVSQAGGMGVFGAVGLGPDRLREELDWIDAHAGGKPYGLDLIVPNKFAGKGEKVDPGKIAASIPDTHTDFVNDLLADHDIDSEGVVESRGISSNFARNLTEAGAGTSLEAGFEYPIKLVANALGVPPQVMLDMGKQHDVPVAALVGAKEHAVAQVEAGVDILVVAGGEAGGHCGDVSTMVLIPEVARAVREMGADTPILAAGGITTGEQMAAAMAMGAAGAWCGLCLADHGRGGDQSGGEGQDAGRQLARYSALALADRQTIASAALALDRCLGIRRRAKSASDADAIHGVRACAQENR